MPKKGKNKGKKTMTEEQINNTEKPAEEQKVEESPVKEEKVVQEEAQN